MLVERIIVLSLRGEQVPLQLREALLDAMSSAPQSVLGLLVDATDWSFAEHRGSADVRAVASVWVELGSRFRRRIALVGPGDLQFGLLRVASAYAGMHGLESSVFRRFEDAMSWLSAGGRTPAEGDGARR